MNADAVVKFFIDLSNKDAIKGVTQLEKKSEALSKKFVKAGKTLTLGLTTPLLAFGVYAKKTATDFDKASNKMQSALGLTNDELKNYENTMKNIYNAGYGESYEDVADAISQVSQQLIELPTDEVEKITKNALTLRDVFGVEVNESVRATKALMTQFGTSGEQAFNLIAQGAQNGLDFSGELIDNINEYSVQFKKLGFNAEDMFNIFQSGADAGAWNLDKIGDAVKEFSIRAIDGSNTTADGFNRLGFNVDDMANKFASGGDTAKKAFYQVIDAIKAMDDPVEQSIVGVDLFGTMWEDLGPQVVTQLGSIRESYNQNSDAMKNMQNIKFDDLGSMLEVLKRQFGDIALEVGNELMPTVQSFIGKLSSLVSWFKQLNPETKKIIGSIVKVLAVVGPLLIVVGKIITPITKVISLTGKVVGMLSKLSPIFSGIKTALSGIMFVAKALGAVIMANPIVAIITGIVALIVLLYAKCEWFRNLVNTIVLGLATTIKTIVTGIASFIGGIIGTIVDYIKNTVLLIVSIVATVIETIYNVVSGVALWIYDNVLLPIFNFFATIFTAIYNTIASFIGTVFAIFGTVASWIYNNVLAPIYNFFYSIFNGIWNIICGVVDKIKSAFHTVANVVKSVFSSVKSFISNIFGTVSGIIKAPINGIIRGVNGVLGTMNRIKVPDWVPGLGGKGINFKMIPSLNVGTNNVKHEGLAYLHQGEAVVPKKYNPAVGGISNATTYVTVIADMDVNKFGKAFVRDVKTFSGGAKNAYNYGGGR